MIQTLKRSAVSVLGRERANRLTGAFYDWQARRRTHKLLRHLPKKGLLVHLGCGQNYLSGWVNVDADRKDEDRIVWDLRNGLPFPDASCSAIFSEHLIEHISRPDAIGLLRECYRVLEPGGVVRMSTPDAEKYLRSYVGDGDFLQEIMNQRPAETKLDCINRMMREGGLHLWVYDGESLIALFREAGFEAACVRDFSESGHPKMAGLDHPERRRESLYVEAER